MEGNCDRDSLPWDAHRRRCEYRLESRRPSCLREYGSMKHYVGERTPEGCEVDVIDTASPTGGYPLPPRHDLRNHSPDGFNWGYAGSGPAQLALALLADALGDDEKAQRHYQDFKFKVIGRLADDKWELSEEDIRQTVAELEA